MQTRTGSEHDVVPGHPDFDIRLQEFADDVIMGPPLARFDRVRDAMRDRSGS